MGLGETSHVVGEHDLVLNLRFIENADSMNEKTMLCVYVFVCANDGWVFKGIISHILLWLLTAYSRASIACTAAHLPTNLGTGLPRCMDGSELVSLMHFRLKQSE